MRIALVSAHFPPNFVSGGTLVPLRMARSLTERGHDVAVFAGRMNSGEPFDITESRDDDSGVPVTWIDITPFTDWSHPANALNPPVTDHFERWLDDVAPEVVHFHSLQALGAGLVTAAARRSIPTVVTMHDFWWLCARQFLADTAARPCSLVVAAGVCECQSGRAALDERARELAPHLAAVDLVLVPSEITRQVFIANGLDEHRIRTHPNGLPPVAGDAVRTSSDVLRIRYTGGANVMKGSRVVEEAVARLDPSPGWRLDVHCPADDPVAQRLGAHDNVRVHEPYRPEELDRVMADTDVLLLPSVMRETHSIVTREAMARGVVVVASDSLGPEEVIDHGHNGLIVPTGDDAALAATIMELVGNSSLVEQLRPDPTDVRWTSVDEQADSLEQHLRDVIRGVDPRPERWTPRHVTFVVGIDGAPLRYRAQYPAEALELRGVATTVLHYSDPRVESQLAATDAVVFYRVPATDRIIDLAEETRKRGVPVVFDVDDLIVDPDVEDRIPALRMLPDDEADLWRQGVRRYRTTLEHCDAYVGSTEPLVEHVTAATGIPSFFKPNTYGLHLARLSDRARLEPRQPGRVRIGYLSGTKTHDEDLRAVAPVLEKVLGHHPDTELWLGGHLPTVPGLDRFGERVRRLPFTSWTELPAALRQLDINLAPLADTEIFNQSKSAIKWLEAALVETPTIASATRPFSSAIDHGVTGVLADGDDEWWEWLDRLVADETLRSRIGRAAHRRALLDWSPFRQGDVVLDILDQVRHLPSRRSTWVDTTVDEPAAPDPVEIDPYPPTAAPSRLATGYRAAVRRTRVVARRVRHVAHVIRTEPPRTVASRARRWLSRVWSDRR